MRRDDEKAYGELPEEVREYIRLIIKKMGYRRKVRDEVREELIGHFEDALKGYLTTKDTKSTEEKEEGRQKAEGRRQKGEDGINDERQAISDKRKGEEEKTEDGKEITSNIERPTSNVEGKDKEQIIQSKEKDGGEELATEGTEDIERKKRIRELLEEFGDAGLIGVLARRAKKRCRALWRTAIVRVFQGVGIIILYLVVCSVPLFIGRPTIKESYLDLLNATVERGSDPCENAQIYYEKAAGLIADDTFGFTGKMKTWPGDINDTERKNLAVWLEQNKAALDMMREGAKRNLCWTVYDANVAKAAVQWRREEKNYPEVISQQPPKQASGPNINKLLLEPGGFYNSELSAVVTNGMPSLNKIRQLAQRMRFQILYEAYTGDVSTAVRDCIVLHRMTEQKIAKGLLIEQLVATAINAMSSQCAMELMDKCELDAGNLLQLQEEFAGSVVLRRSAIELSGEKVAYLDIVQRCFTDDGAGDGRLLKQGLPLIAMSGESFWGNYLTMRFPSRRETMQTINTFYDEADARLHKTPWEMYKENGEKKKDWDGGENTIIFLSILAPAYDKTGAMSWRLNCHCKAVVTVAAVLRYKAEKGTLPEDLKELVDGGYLKEVPMDPFSGGMLKYRRTADNFILYSPGMSFKDHGGKEGSRRMWSEDGDTIFWPVE